MVLYKCDISGQAECAGGVSKGFELQVYIAVYGRQNRIGETERSLHGHISSFHWKVKVELKEKVFN